MTQNPEGLPLSSDEVPRLYDPHDAATRYYTWWEQAGLFRGDPSARGEPYCIVIPPPNVTGSLHMGHALDNTLQDVLIRYHRMDGFNTVWIPGTDHAGIATQWVVERELAKEGLTRHQIGREMFEEHIWRWKETNGGRIIHQLRKLGCSCDWSRERFTMDEGLSRAVRECFVRMYDEGLIYRDTRLINWDTIGQTAISDLEVEHEEGVQGELWSFAYPLEVAGEGIPPEIVVATTRPETMLGDTAIAVHSEDPRYKHVIGQNVVHPITGRLIPIIADDILVDPKFGTGAVKVTPAHDPNDFETGKRHNLEFINILNVDGTINGQGGEFEGLSVQDARKAVKARLAELGLERGTQVHLMNIGRSQRSGAVVEPMVSTQWFVKMRPLATPAIAAVEHGFTQFVPKQWENFYFGWMRDIRDWCISRQLWWGHRIPAWYCQDCGQVIVSRTDPAACSKCGSERLERDPDVLDTWFSSALWPFSTLGWPEPTADLAKWFPTSVLVTAYDIIFFWVARMIYSSLHHMGSVPFKDVCIHGLIRDAHGQKMSKTKGNVVDPLETIEKFGVDAFRYALTQAATQGSDIMWDDSRVENARKFVNKIWQAFRFVMMNMGDEILQGTEKEGEETPSIYDHWILARTGEATRRIRDAVDTYRFNDYGNELMAFIWSELCDWYIELAKVSLYGDDVPPAARRATRHTLLQVFSAVARLLHPVMPFFSEEIWQRLPGMSGSAMVAPFPKADDFPSDPQVLEEMALLQEVVMEMRRVRGEMNISPRVPVTLWAMGQEFAALERHLPALRHLANITGFHLGFSPEGARATLVVRGLEIYLPLAGVIDVAEERARLVKEMAKATKDVEFLEKRLGNPSFAEKAPADVVAEARGKLDTARLGLEALRSSLARLG